MFISFYLLNLDQEKSLHTHCLKAARIRVLPLVYRAKGCLRVPYGPWDLLLAMAGSWLFYFLVVEVSSLSISYIIVGRYLARAVSHSVL